MIGVSTPSKRLRALHAADREGADPADGRRAAVRVQEIEERLRALHPEARLENVDAGAPSLS